MKSRLFVRFWPFNVLSYLIGTIFNKHTLVHTVVYGQKKQKTFRIKSKILPRRRSKNNRKACIKRLINVNVAIEVRPDCAKWQSMVSAYSNGKPKAWVYMIIIKSIMNIRSWLVLKYLSRYCNMLLMFLLTINKYILKTGRMQVAKKKRMQVARAVILSTLH